MPNSPTPNAPKDYDELIKLLDNDTKVKVAGNLSFLPSVELKADRQVSTWMVSSEERSCRNPNSFHVSSRMVNSDFAQSSLDGIVGLPCCPLATVLVLVLVLSGSPRYDPFQRITSL